MEHDFLYELLSAHALSGHEISLQRKVMTHMKPYVDQIITDEHGNVTSVLNPNASTKILFSGHIDEIGLVVTAHTKEGFLKVARVGGIYPKSFLGQKVRIITKKEILYGAVVNTKELQGKSDITDTDLIIDIGAKHKEDAQLHVPVGSAIFPDTDWRPLLNNCITSRALDNRTGAYIVLEALKRAREKHCQNGIYSVTTVGEETAFHGAPWVGARIKPTMAIAVDVTFSSDYPGGDDGVRGRIELDGGPGICLSPLVNPVMNRLLYQAAKNLGITLQPVITPGRTLTDADAIHISGLGVPTALINLPLRSMHTPGEVCCLNDIEACIALLSEFAMIVDESTTLNPFNDIQS